MSDEQPQHIDGLDLLRNAVELEVDALRWRPGVYALILRGDDNEILVLDNEVSGFIELPGGGIELWERLPEALQREVWEETGLEVRMTAVIGVESHFFLSPSGNQNHALCIICTAEVLGGSLRETIIDGEHSVNPHWASIDEIDLDDLDIGARTVQAYLQ